MNMSSTLLGTREMQIKPQWDTTAHPPEWLQFKNPTILSVDNNLEQWKSVNWYNTLENCLAASTKVEHVQPLWLSDPTTNRNACTCVPNKNICRNIRPNSSKQEMVHMLITVEWVNKLWHIYKGNIIQQWEGTK